MKTIIAFDFNETNKYSYQKPFPKTTKCCRCGGKARLAFVASEDYDTVNKVNNKFVADIHNNTGKKGGFWLHDCCCVAVYFCADCLEPTALYNQA